MTIEEQSAVEIKLQKKLDALLRKFTVKIQILAFAQATKPQQSIVYLGKAW